MPVSRGLHDYATSFDSDGQHQSEQITDFDYSAVDKALGEPEPAPEQVAFEDMTAALSLILDWICGGQCPKFMGGRALALRLYLDPANSEFQTLDEIGQHVGSSKQMISKALMEFRRATGVRMTMGKLASTSDVYSRAQKASVAAGVHSRFVRKGRRQA